MTRRGRSSITLAAPEVAFLDLVQAVLGCSRKDAVAWLEGYAGLELRQPTERDRRLHKAAAAEARMFLTWKEECLEKLRLLRAVRWATYMKASQLLLRHGGNHRMSDHWCDIAIVEGMRWEELDRRYDELRAAKPSELLEEFRAQVRGRRCV